MGVGGGGLKNEWPLILLSPIILIGMHGHNHLHLPVEQFADKEIFEEGNRRHSLP